MKKYFYLLDIFVLTEDGELETGHLQAFANENVANRERGFKEEGIEAMGKKSTVSCAFRKHSVNILHSVLLESLCHYLKSISNSNFFY